MSSKMALQWWERIQKGLFNIWVKVGAICGFTCGELLLLCWKLATVFPKEGDGKGTVGQSLRGCRWQ